MRITRHDRLVHGLAALGRLRDKEVAVEPHIQTKAGLRKPDLIFKTHDKAIVMDCQIVSDVYDLNEEHAKKSRIYNYPEIRTEVAKLLKVDPNKITFTSCTFNWRGALATGCLSDIMNCGILAKDLRKLSMRVVEGGFDSLMTYLHRTERTSGVVNS